MHFSQKLVRRSHHESIGYREYTNRGLIYTPISPMGTKHLAWSAATGVLAHQRYGGESLADRREAGSSWFLKLPTAQAEGFLVCLHSPYPAIGPRARSARLSSRRASFVEDIRASERNARLSSVVTLACALRARFQTLLREVALPREERSGMHLIDTVVLLRSSDRLIAEPANTIRLSNVLCTHSCRGNKKGKWFYRLTGGDYPSPWL
jgi:hypothetical protein